MGKPIDPSEYEFDRPEPRTFKRILREDLADKDRHKRRLWWVWAIFLAVGVALELIAIFTDEKDLPTLSRFTWWLRDHWPKIVIPAIILVGIWAILHLAGGECFLNLC